MRTLHRATTVAQRYHACCCVLPSSDSLAKSRPLVVRLCGIVYKARAIDTTSQTRWHEISSEQAWTLCTYSVLSYGLNQGFWHLCHFAGALDIQCPRVVDDCRAALWFQLGDFSRTFSKIEATLKERANSISHFISASDQWVAFLRSCRAVWLGR